MHRDSIRLARLCRDHDGRNPVLQPWERRPESFRDGILGLYLIDTRGSIAALGGARNPHPDLSGLGFIVYPDASGLQPPFLTLSGSRRQKSGFTTLGAPSRKLSEGIFGGWLIDTGSAG
jgi:hypothetical protein